ncbi:uncharacterized protein [Elaeis guineensis]|uniref:uncharacterized protein n=1 Tax=Elaeis guineensis var. tenera TaxID=51953 RepID=UPI003C6D6267
MIQRSTNHIRQLRRSNGSVVDDSGRIRAEILQFFRGWWMASLGKDYPILGAQSMMLQELGFREEWIGWIIDCIKAPSFAILVNDTPTDFFHSSVGLRQGYPLSPYLFILCTGALSKALRAVVQRQVLELYWPAPGAQLLSHILFTDDCLLIGRAST